MALEGRRRDQRTRPAGIFVLWSGSLQSRPALSNQDTNIPVTDRRPHHVVLHAVQALPDFRRLLELRAVSQFADGLFQAGLVGGLLFSPERQATPLAIAGAFAALYLPYSLLGPFAGALLDRWDRRQVLIVANLKPAKLMGIPSQGMVLAAKEQQADGSERLVLATVAGPIAAGSRVA